MAWRLAIARLACGTASLLSLHTGQSEVESGLGVAFLEDSSRTWSAKRLPDNGGLLRGNSLHRLAHPSHPASHPKVQLDYELAMSLLSLGHFGAARPATKWDRRLACDAVGPP